MRIIYKHVFVLKNQFATKQLYDIIFCSEIDKFDIFGCGKSVLSNYETRSEMEDRIHFFTEECDSLQVY